MSYSQALVQKTQARNKEALDCMEPGTRRKFKAFIDYLWNDLNILLLLYSGTRDFAEQNALYAQGRDPAVPGDIVTNAKGGQSWHNFGRAGDVVPLNYQGQPLWTTTPWATVGQAGKQFGLEWGGDFSTIYDPTHFQNREGMDLQTALAKYPNGYKCGAAHHRWWPWVLVGGGLIAAPIGIAKKNKVVTITGLISAATGAAFLTIPKLKQ